MKNIKDFETKMIYKGKRNVKYALVECSYCGEDTWEQWQRIKRQENFFCNREHCNLWQKDQAKHVGKEKARFNWVESDNRWIAQWWEEVDGKRILKNTTKAKWLWEQNHDDVPNGYWVTYKDGNPANCELENLELITRGERMSEALKGHEVSDETKQKISRAHKGKTLSTEHKEKISRWTKSKWEDGTFGSVDHLQKLSNSLKGKNNPNYIDGRSKKEYSRDFYNMRLNIRERDGNMCKACDKKVKGLGGHIHHVDGDKQNNDPYNLVLLCSSCHRRVHNESKNINPMILIFRSMLKY